MEKCGGAGQATDDNIIWRMRIAFWVTKATDTHTENMYYLLLFHGNNDYANVSRSFVCTYIACLVNYSVVEVYAQSIKSCV